MKMQIVADGRSRLLRALREKIKARFAKELEKAGPLGRVVLHGRMEAEVQREWRKLEPSPYALFSRSKFPGARD